MEGGHKAVVHDVLLTVKNVTGSQIQFFEHICTPNLETKYGRILCVCLILHCRTALVLLQNGLG